METENENLLDLDSEIEIINDIENDSNPDFFSNPIHPNLKLLSYSSESLFHSCAKKYQLRKLLNIQPGQTDDKGDKNFGSVVGIGVQEYFLSGNIEIALFKMFLAWNDHLDTDTGEGKNKRFWDAVIAVQNFSQFKDTELGHYDLVWIAEAPACELGFEIILPEQYKYRGKIDIVLKHRLTQAYVIFEIKTTGSNNLNEAMYKNSGQGTDYGIVLDSLLNKYEGHNLSSYWVVYIVYQTTKREWTKYQFLKTSSVRLKRIQQMLKVCAEITNCWESGFFPQNGNACFSYGTQCAFFECCEMDENILLQKYGNINHLKDKEDEYPIKLDIEDLLLAQAQLLGV